MILDRLENASRYYSVVPRFDKVMAWLENNDARTIPAGAINVEGEDLIIKVIDMEGKEEKDCLFETHDAYIDIQIPLTGAEKMGWKSRHECKNVHKPYDAAVDMALYKEQATTMCTVMPGEFTVFFPEDGHQPGIMHKDKNYRKIIVKTRV